ncbi:MAG TPA: DUF4157 domain-containing protein, partial [Phnomibacter sp.]|nr:DUF4157 domain-containing protein [Phnomibacter sp.]
MLSTAEKTTKPATTVHRKAEGTSFFGKQIARSSQQEEQVQTRIQRSTFGSQPGPSFFQPRLSVSTPGDPYEREADATADAVMRMSEPAASPAQEEKEQVQRQVNDSAFMPGILHRQAADEEEIQAKEEERKEEDQSDHIMQPMLQRQEEPEEEETVQAKLQRAASHTGSTATKAGVQRHPNKSTTTTIHRSSRGRLLSLQGSSRGPPAVTPRFESTLQQRTAGGSAMPEPTRQFMESRFGADFSGVRIHTDATAQEMSSSIRAHAFTYQNHIFFNSGKFDTDSSAGKTLLAHELTHTIQQGASPVASNIARKHQFTAVQTKSIQMASAPQLDAAVALARGEQGKVIANKAQPNGERVGSDRLVEYFKTTFGEDKIIPRYTGAPNTVVES